MFASRGDWRTTELTLGQQMLASGTRYEVWRKLMLVAWLRQRPVGIVLLVDYVAMV